MHDIVAPARALDWLRWAQLADGSWPVSPAAQDSSWVSAWAVWALARAGRRDQRLERGIVWLATTPVLSFADPASKEAIRRLLQLDPGATGWPWQPGEGSWVTPTALAITALCASGLRGHPRLSQGRSYLADRACTAGGWNFGNPTMLGRAYPPLAVDSGAALLALRHLGVPATDADVTGALAWLARMDGVDGGPLDRAWACIGLGAWGSGGSLFASVRKDVEAKNTESSVATLSLALGLIALAPAEQVVVVPP